MTTVQWKYLDLEYPVWKNTSGEVLILMIEETEESLRSVVLEPDVLVQWHPRKGSIMIVDYYGNSTQYLLSDVTSEGYEVFCSIMDDQSGLDRQELPLEN